MQNTTDTRSESSSFFSLTVKFLLILIILIASMVLSVKFGSVDVTVSEIMHEISIMLSTGHPGDSSNSMILWQIRIPRTIFAALCGMGLSLCGMVLQTMTRNDLADPYVLGVSSGASTGAVIAITVAVMALIVWAVRADLDLMLLGEGEAEYLGINMKRMQLFVIVLSSAVVALLVSKAGIIGFVGLITPHMARAVCGPTHGKLVVFSSVIGALVMVWADVLSRALFAPEEIPIGVLTSIVGAPIFLWIVTHRYGEEQA